ncbi:MAG: flagellar basal body-associated FliL family protein, partial [Pirellulaceae bacterium]|nr:flagellar basal body-associated FliL family protein [Pirellulaceae bacterium]
WKLGILALGSLAFASCGGAQATNPAALEANELLDLLDGRKNGLDLETYAEVDIGSFRMTLAPQGEERALRVSFRLVAIVPDSQKASFEAELPRYEKRIRDAAIALVGSTDHEQLAEPSLDYLKGEMVTTINRILQKRLVRDAAFSSFSLGHQWPKEDAPPAKPKPKAGGHH